MRKIVQIFEAFSEKLNFSCYCTPFCIYSFWQTNIMYENHFFFPDTFFSRQNSNKNPILAIIWRENLNLKQKFREITMRRGLTFIVCNGGSEHDGAGGNFTLFLSQFSGFFQGWHWCQIKAEIRPSQWPTHEATIYLAFNWEILSWFWNFSRVFSMKKGKKIFFADEDGRVERRFLYRAAPSFGPCSTVQWC